MLTQQQLAMLGHVRSIEAWAPIRGHSKERPNGEERNSERESDKDIDILTVSRLAPKA